MFQHRLSPIVLWKHLIYLEMAILRVNNAIMWSLWYRLVYIWFRWRIFLLAGLQACLGFTVSFCPCPSCIVTALYISSLSNMSCIWQKFKTWSQVLLFNVSFISFDLTIITGSVIDVDSLTGANSLTTVSFISYESPASINVWCVACALKLSSTSLSTSASGHVMILGPDCQRWIHRVRSSLPLLTSAFTPCQVHDSWVNNTRLTHACTHGHVWFRIVQSTNSPWIFFICLGQGLEYHWLITVLSKSVFTKLSCLVFII